MEIPYEQIIESLNDKAFEYLKENLWPLCNYHVLEMEDVRKIDILEKIMELREKFHGWLGDITTDETRFYFDQLKFYFKEVIKVKPDSRAEQYHNRALEILNSDSVDDTIIESIVMIYTSFLRGMYHNSLDYSFEDGLLQLIAVDMTFGVELEDAEIMDCLRKNDNLTPKSITIRNSYYKRGQLIQEQFPKYIVHAKKNYVYMINLLYLTHALQTAGFFEGDF